MIKCFMLNKGYNNIIVKYHKKHKMQTSCCKMQKHVMYKTWTYRYISQDAYMYIYCKWVHESYVNERILVRKMMILKHCKSSRNEWSSERYDAKYEKQKYEEKLLYRIVRYRIYELNLVDIYNTLSDYHMLSYYSIIIKT